MHLTCFDYRPKMLASILIFELCLASSLGVAQVLRANLSCGKAGVTKVCVTGSGWAEPNPPCRYEFFFDSVSVAPDQQDGLFGPPIASFIVPSGAAAGNHTIDVKLVENDNNALLQEKGIPFKVVTNTPNPLAGSSTSGKKISFSFDPTDVCDVSPCKKLVFIQVDRRIGIKDDGTEVPQPDSTWGFDPVGDKDLTAGDYTVDRIIGKKVPYYHDGNGSGDNTATPPVPATSSDGPSQDDAGFPAGFKGVRLEFETAVFCAEGDDKGEYFGRILWNWSKSKGGGAGTSTITSRDRAQPSSNFMDALSKWDSNPDHPFTLPSSTLPLCP